MPANRTDLLSVTRTLLRWAFYIDIGLLILLVIVGVALVLGDLSHMNITGIPSATPEQKLFAVRAGVIGSLLCCLLVLPVLRGLLGIVDSTRAGDPFVPENGAWLRNIGWLMLGINVVTQMTASLVARGSVTIPPLSFGGLMTVLMIFVLARIFDVGSHMRAELQDTV